MAQIPQELIEEIKNSADIVAYVSRYVQLKKSGKNYKGLCPFHKEKTPSFFVTPSLNRFHCFGCGKGGNVFTFLMEMEKISFVESVRLIAQDLGIRIPVTNYKSDEENIYDILYKINKTAADFFQKQYNENDNNIARSYIKKRGLKSKTVKKFLIGYAPDSWDKFLKDSKIASLPKQKLSELGLIKQRESGQGYYSKFRNRLIFPFQSISGKIIGFGGRRLNDNDQPKYLNSPENEIYKKGHTLYGLHQAIASVRKIEMVIIVEGYFDLLRLVDAGIENVVASSGTAMTDKQALLIKRYTNNAAIAYDSDKAGQDAAIRNSEILEKANLNASIIQIPEPHDPDSFIAENGKSGFIDLIKKRVYPLDFSINRFKINNPNASFEQINSFIAASLENFITIPNEIRVGQYIHTLAEKFNISESLIINQYKSIKRKKSGIQKRSDDEADDTTPTRKFKYGEWRAEEGLIFLLLQNDQSIVKHILHQISAADFENAANQEIFEQISYCWDEKSSNDLDCIKESLSEEALNALNSIILLEIKKTKQYADDCIFRLQKWHLEKRYNEIKHMLQTEKSSKEAVTHFMTELTEIRKKISQLHK